MTREEAIKRLREYAAYSYGIWHGEEEDTKAFDMAIEALELWDNDLISRQAAAVEKILRNKDAKPLNESDYQDGIRAGLDIAYCEIRDLPSAEPVHGEWIITYIGQRTRITCSNCGQSGRKISDNYCPNCGAKMGEKE